MVKLAAGLLAGFRELAEASNGKFRRFQQIDGLSETEEGICAGWSLLFLSLEGREVSERLCSPQMEASGADPTFKFHASYIQEMTRAGELAKVAPKLGLIETQTHATKQGANIAFLCLGNPHKLAIITLGNHACAYSRAGKIGRHVFFDPNYGFASFEQDADFTQFVTRFFEAANYSKEDCRVGYFKKVG